MAELPSQDGSGYAQWPEAHVLSVSDGLGDGRRSSGSSKSISGKLGAVQTIARPSETGNTYSSRLAGTTISLWTTWSGCRITRRSGYTNLRPTALGRKNRLFVGDLRPGRTSLGCTQSFRPVRRVIPGRRDRWQHGPWLSSFACALSGDVRRRFVREVRVCAGPSAEECCSRCVALRSRVKAAMDDT